MEEAPADVVQDPLLLSVGQSEDAGIAMRNLDSEPAPAHSTRRGSSGLKHHQHSHHQHGSLRQMLHAASARDSNLDYAQGTSECCCCFFDPLRRFRRKQMSPLQQLFLTPYEKWNHYGVLPLKAILHLIVCLLATFVIAYYQADDAHYYRHVSKSLCKDVISGEPDCDYDDHSKGMEIYTVEEFLESYRFAIDGYYAHIHERTGVDRTFPAVTSEANLQLEWTAFTNRSFDVNEDAGDFQVSSEKETYTVTPEDIYPFNEGTLDIPFRIYRTQSLLLTAEFRSYYIHENIAMCRLFEMKLLWDFQFRGIMVLSLNVNTAGVCNGSSLTPLDESVSYSVLCILSICLCALTIRSVVKRVLLISHMKLILSDDGTPDMVQLRERDNCCACRQEAISMKNIFVFVPIHFWFMLIGCTCIIYSTAVLLVSTQRLPTKPLDSGVWALGMIFIWLEVRRYLNFREDSETFVLFVILDKAAPKVLNFMFSCLPVIMAYTVAGVIMFAPRQELFRDLISSFVTLFCIANGDAMIDVFTSVYESRGVLGEFYLFTWCSIVIYVVVNVFLVIIQMTYEEIWYRQLDVAEAQNSTESFEGTPSQISGTERKAGEKHELDDKPDFGLEMKPRRQQIARHISLSKLKSRPGTLSSIPKLNLVIKTVSGSVATGDRPRSFTTSERDLMEYLADS